MKDSAIDLSEDPEITPAMFAKAIARKGLKPLTKKQLISLRIDSDVVAWFRSQGRGYQSQINELLRAYMTERKSIAAKPR